MPADRVPLPEQLGFSTVWFDLPDLRMHAAASGPVDGPLVILNVPHPNAMFRALWGGNLRQLLKSWYIFFFQIPGLPEKLLGWRDHAALLRMLQRSSNPGTFTPQDALFYREAWSQPGALSAMIGWYRQMVRSVARFADRDFAFRVKTPTRILWGEQDAVLGVELAEQSLSWLDQGELVRFPEATHWVHQDLPDVINQQLLEHFSSKSVMQRI